MKLPEDNDMVLMTEPVKISRRYTYDAENQLTSVTYENGIVVSYTYDKAGNRLSVTSSDMLGQAAPVMETVPREPKKITAKPLPVHTSQQQLCRNCGTPMIPGNKFCSICGAPVNPAVPAAPGAPAATQTPSVCPSCGSPIRAGIKFCGDCGRHL
jgi:YD repeat-containing protein